MVVRANGEFGVPDGVFFALPVNYLGEGNFAVRSDAKISHTGQEIKRAALAFVQQEWIDFIDHETTFDRDPVWRRAHARSQLLKLRKLASDISRASTLIVAAGSSTN
jgi:hypothetical protein